MILPLLAILGQLSCPEGATCSDRGFVSNAALAYGSGTPDFDCGNHDLLADGGWGGYSKYCLIQTNQTESYWGAHGDLSIASKYGRYAGYLLTVQNPFLGGDMFAVAVRWNGDLIISGNLIVSGNGMGLRNPDSYTALYGLSTTPTTIPHVVVGPTVPQANGGWAFGVWTGYQWSFRSRDDGAFSFGDQVFTLSTNDTGLALKQELPDGGTRTAVVNWQ